MGIACRLSLPLVLLLNAAPALQAENLTSLTVERLHRRYAAISSDGLFVPINTHEALMKYASEQGPPAWGWFQDDINSTGWSSLQLRTGNNHSDVNQAYAAGFLEASLTTQRMWEFVKNNNVLLSSELKAYIRANFEWVAHEAERRQDEPYWYQVLLLLRQLDGMVHGYQASASPDQQLSQMDLLQPTLQGEFEDLCTVYGCSKPSNILLGEADPGPITGGQHRRQRGDGHCSVLIKLLWDENSTIRKLKDVIVGHTTWSPYESMTRVWKLYDFPWQMSGVDHTTVAGRQISFPSYPGALFSMDDFYQMDSGLVVTETTNNNRNESLWQFVKPEGAVSNWARGMLANRLARSGEEWQSLYRRFNSGTYNNQWMVVDMKRLTAEGSMPGTLWVLEQMPGLVVARDMSSWLQQRGHWESYNRPFFPAIFNISDQPAAVNKYGDHYSWSQTARAQIFNRLVPSVTNEAGFKRVIRYNKFQSDPISIQGCYPGRSASNAIAERGDLTALDSGCIGDVARVDEGATDAKFTTLSRWHSGKLRAEAQSGPTFDDQNVFEWSKSPFAHISHVGLPDVWNFSWISVEWQSVI